MPRNLIAARIHALHVGDVVLPLQAGTTNNRTCCARPRCRTAAPFRHPRPRHCRRCPVAAPSSRPHGGARGPLRRLHCSPRRPSQIARHSDRRSRRRRSCGSRRRRHGTGPCSSGSPASPGLQGPSEPSRNRPTRRAAATATTSERLLITCSLESLIAVRSARSAGRPASSPSGSSGRTDSSPPGPRSSTSSWPDSDLAQAQPR